MAAGGDEMDERDFYVDNTQVSYQMVMSARTRLAGGEYIVYDRTDAVTKCTLCRNILRDVNTIVEHLKAQKHVHAYFVSALSGLQLVWIGAGETLSRDVSRQTA
jgi:hypothetical protein